MAYTEFDKRRHIMEIQKYLRHIAHITGTLPMIIPDGIYGEKTREAVSQFQRQNSLPVTGEVDNRTWDELVRQYNLTLAKLEIPRCIHPFTNPTSIISKGDEGYIVYLIQVMLNTICEDAHNMFRVEIDGKYGEKTESAIKRYQSLAGLSPTGATDIETWNMLSQTYNSVTLNS